MMHGVPDSTEQSANNWRSNPSFQGQVDSSEETGQEEKKTGEMD